MSTDKPESTALAVQRPRPMVENAQPLFDTERFEHFQRAATALMHSSLLPESIRGAAPAQCFSNLMLVFDLSDRWKIPALAIAQCIAIVHNKIVYEGKLISAMLTAQGMDLDYHYTGERGTPGYRVYVSDKPFESLTDEQLAALAPDKYPRGYRMIDGSVADWQTFGKDSRTANPAWTGAAQRNQLAYRGSREWVRLYEPGLLLGVYGEDEIDAIQGRRDERAAQAAAPAITAGFTRPAAAADEIRDAVVEEITPDASQEGAGGPATDAVPNTPATSAKAASASPGPADQPVKTKAGGGNAAGKRKAPTREEVGAETLAALAEVEPELVEQVLEDHGDPATDEVDDDRRDGLAADAFEDGHEVGLTLGDLKVPRAWSEFADDWTAGWHAGGAERVADLQQDAEDDEEEGFAGDDDDTDQTNAPPLSAFEDFANVLQTLEGWGDIKAELNALSKSEAWREALAVAGAPLIHQVRVDAWARMVQLEDLGVATADPLMDLTAFRCFASHADDPDVILASWQDLVMLPLFQSLSSGQMSTLEAAIKRGVEDLRQPSLPS